MLEGLCQLRRFFLARVLTPAARVVVLLCGVDSLTPLLDLVPLNGDECLQISSEQDAHEYLSTVTDIVRRGTCGSFSCDGEQNVNLVHVDNLNHKQKEQSSTSVSAYLTTLTLMLMSRPPCASRPFRAENAHDVSECLNSSSETCLLLISPHRKRTSNIFRQQLQRHVGETEPASLTCPQLTRQSPSASVPVFPNGPICMQNLRVEEGACV